MGNPLDPVSYPFMTNIMMDTYPVGRACEQRLATRWGIRDPPSPRATVSGCILPAGCMNDRCISPHLLDCMQTSSDRAVWPPHRLTQICGRCLLFLQRISGNVDLGVLGFTPKCNSLANAIVGLGLPPTMSLLPFDLWPLWYKLNGSGRCC